MNKFAYYNDTQREVSINPATELHGAKCELGRIGEETIVIVEGERQYMEMIDNGLVKAKNLFIGSDIGKINLL